MCNLYNLKVKRWEVAEYYSAEDVWRDELKKNYVSPGRPGLVVIQGETSRKLTIMRWGFPPPTGVKSAVVNVRNYVSPFWRTP